jgi:hypothetical protein
VKRRNKYNAQKVRLDGLVFDSKKEAKRYGELRLMEKAGEIKYLRVHPSGFLLHCPAAGWGLRGDQVVCEYRPDFTYTQGGVMVVEDVKGIKTALYLLKKKWLNLEYGIEIREV